VGKAVVAAGVELSDDELAQHAATSKDLSQQIEEIDGTIENVRSILREKSEAQKEIEEKEADIRRHQESLPGIYEEIGKASFERFRDNPFVDQEYAQVFSDLVKHHEELREVQMDLDRLDSTMEQKPLLEKVVARGKRIVLANRLSAKEGAERRLFRKVGKDITRTDFIQSMDDPDLTAVATPYYETEKRIEDLTHAVENLRTRDQQLNETLSGIVGEQRPDRFVASREADRDDKIANRDAAYEVIGRAAADGELNVPEGDVSSLLTEIQELQSQNDDKRATIARLEAALKVEELERRITAKMQTVDGLELQVQGLERQIADEKQELENLAHEKTEQEKARGPVESL
jgi:chromosome segregation ATPase